jgi:Glycosyl hydrolase family 12
VAVAVALTVLAVACTSGDPGSRGAGRSAVACNPQYAITHWAVTQLDGGVYEMQTNLYNSRARFSMCGDGGENFTITESQIGVPVNGVPGGYPSIYRGCHWGACTKDSGLPIQVSSMEANTNEVRLSYDTRVSAGGVWDDAFDIFFTPCDDHGVSHSNCTQTTQPDREMMIWLSHSGPIIPGGNSTNVTIDGINFNLWWDGNHTMWYVISSPSLTNPRLQSNPRVQNLNLGDFIRDAVSRAYIPSPSWYLMDIEAGFEIWQGGQGLAANSVSICTPSPVGCPDSTGAAGAAGSPSPLSRLPRLSRRCSTGRTAARQAASLSA